MLQVQHPDGRRMLLSEDPDAPEASFHAPERRWGKGFVITDRGSWRFDRPGDLRWTTDGVDASYPLGPLRLGVRRRAGDSWTEEYTLRNVSDAPVTVTSYAVSTPWRDVSFSAADSLRGAVHAHLWTGGADGWVWAVPVDGSSPGLGMALTEGELWAYSVESRDQFTGSNVRGHLYLHATDAARAPHTLGGQPEIVLAPGEEHRLAWRLRWYDDLAALHADRTPLLTPERLSAEVGTPIEIQVAPSARVTDPGPDQPGLRVVQADLAGRSSRAVLFAHPPLREVVECRIRYALDHQRPTERAGSRAAAFVPIDTRTGLTVLAGGWPDWDDARERVGTALLLQEARVRGWGNADELAQALAAYQAFVTEHVITADGTVAPAGAEPRLYDFPWFARFLFGQGERARAVMIMDHYYALGGGHFLAFDLGPLLTELADGLDADRRPDDATRLRRHLLDQAAAMLAAGEDLPAHEVNYEQSMVAPMLELLLAARRLDPAVVPDHELVRRLPWLTSFAADQPDARVGQVPVRHWDGYWFGALRLWGDVFPHYWAGLSAGVFLNWPADLATPTVRTQLWAAGEAILRANLIGFSADGSATCAFVYPSCVDGRPAHRPDPLANDQDWALVHALRFGTDVFD